MPLKMSEKREFSKIHRRYFKNSKKLLLKRFNKSENGQQQEVLVMSETSVNFSRSHRYKEKFLEILDCSDRETAKEKMREWTYNASNCVYRSLRNVPTLCKIGSPAYSTLFHHLRQTRIIRTRFLSVDFSHCRVKILVNPLGLTAFCALLCKKSATQKISNPKRAQFSCGFLCGGCEKALAL